MYRSYRDTAGHMSVGEVSKAARRRIVVQSVIILLLAASLAVMGIVGGRSIHQQKTLQAGYLEKIQGESAMALSLTSSLSRTAGANSAGTLGKIRSCVYAMEMLNGLNLEVNGIRFVDDGYFTNIYGILDDYNSRLITGTATTDCLQSLNTALSNLNQILLAIG